MATGRRHTVTIVSVASCRPKRRMKLRNEGGDTFGRLPHRTQSDDHDTQGGGEPSRQCGDGEGDRR